MRLLTIHDHLHVLDETVDNLESLRCSCPGLVLRKSAQPLQHSLDFLLSKKLLYKFLCVPFSRATCQQGQTHSVVPVGFVSLPARA